MNMRKQKGQIIAQTCKISERDGYYLVPSQTRPDRNYVVTLGKKPTCSCPDFRERGDEIGSCKHIFAVEARFVGYKDNLGNTVITQSTRLIYSQDWAAYDKSQTTEKEVLVRLLNEACEGIEQPDYEFGRPKLPIRDMVFASVLKVYTTFSLRRFTSDMRTSQEKGYIVRTPHYSTVALYMESPELTPILERLIKMTSLPLSSVETKFAVDSSGFSTSVFSRWFDHRYGRNKEERFWMKAHVCVGVKTNVVTAVKLTDGNSADVKEFEDLVRATADGFNIGEVSADKAYSSKENVNLVGDLGGTAFIPFKKNARGKYSRGNSWRKMWLYYQLNQEEFLEHYHKRSNVETTFSMIKRKFGTHLRSKTRTAQVNEILCKVLCHNICVVIQEMNELGVKPKFN